MPAYNFKAQFAPAVEAGSKLGTIRGRSAKVGATAYLFTGMRTKACRRLGQGTITACTPITLGFTDSGMTRVKLGSKNLNQAAIIALAVADGFESPRAMVNWFRETHFSKTELGLGAMGDHDVFSGYLINWELPK